MYERRFLDQGRSKALSNSSSAKTIDKDFGDNVEESLRVRRMSIVTVESKSRVAIGAWNKIVIDSFC